eukprot:TRINITY_DN5026_c0_g1_i1.p1 TRINITY_DN5026_c0_g1~~TRINITY_DN5026_c0_g1_i1.p1  ORF type:complete len:302 (+),score=37.73 TRINITY_DN5026_c0_g1_i1:28-906(+)
MDSGAPIETGSSDVPMMDSSSLPHRHTAGQDLSLFFIIISSLFLAQVLFTYWQHKSKWSFQLVTLLELAFIPLYMSYTRGYWFFIFIWTVHAICSGSVLYMATRVPLHPKTPGFIFEYFHMLHWGSCLLAQIACICFFFSFIILPAVLGPSGIILVQFFMVAIFYGLYFGVFSRDLAEFATGRIATTIGIASTDEVMATNKQREGSCALCQQDLEPETATELDCSHRFHESCARGWVLVGKKETCPVCHEKVHVRNVVKNHILGVQTIQWSRSESTRLNSSHIPLSRMPSSA